MRPEGQFFGFSVLSDLSIGMCAQRTGWPPTWTLSFGENDTLLLWDNGKCLGVWAPSQEDLMTGDWVTGD